MGPGAPEGRSGQWAHAPVPTQESGALWTVVCSCHDLRLPPASPEPWRPACPGPTTRAHLQSTAVGVSLALTQVGVRVLSWGSSAFRELFPKGGHVLLLQVGCKLSLVFFQYCTMANFYWLLVEGLYLHTLLVAMFSPGRRFLAYLLIGWGKDSPHPSACAHKPSRLLTPVLCRVHFRSNQKVLF